jgi:polyphosphate kinase 2 (PPK2 family)
MKKHALNKILKVMHPQSEMKKGVYEKKLKPLQLRMLRIQQGLWHKKERAIILFEGFDTAGKGGAIRRLTENLDPRAVQVYGIAEPTPDEQARHYLYRFWQKLPLPGMISVFDRSWYGRVLVERVEGLTPKERWKAAYREILEFETMLQDDGITLIKIFLAIDKEEQMRRFQERLKDPYKQWKLTKADVEARSKWTEYVKAAEEMMTKTHTKKSPWHLLAANDKHRARLDVLSIVTQQLGTYVRWMESKASRAEVRSLEEEIKKYQI